MCFYTLCPNEKERKHRHFGFIAIVLLSFKAWLMFFVFPMLRLHKRKPHAYTLMLICSQVSNFIFKQFVQKQSSVRDLIKWCSENMQQILWHLWRAASVTTKYRVLEPVTRSVLLKKSLLKSFTKASCIYEVVGW